MKQSGAFRKQFVCFLALFVVGSVRIGSQALRPHTYPKVDHIPSGELLITGGRSTLPADFVPRVVDAPGIALTKSAESWVPTLYDDAAGYCTIGYGHLIKKAGCDGTEPPEFRSGISKKRGSELLGQDLRTSQYAVMTLVRAKMTDGQFAALTDFVFNVGSQNFRNSTLLSVVNNNQTDRIPAQFRRWIMAGGKPLSGLKKRREGEINLFFAGVPKPRGVPPLGEVLSPIDVRNGEHRTD